MLKNKKSVAFVLVIRSTLFCLILSLIRVGYTQSGMFLFLVWNLFLALIPFFITEKLKNSYLKKSKIYLTLIFLVWLLFLPNAPYILTDIIHLKKNLVMPFWFDMILIISYAWTGMISFYLSVFEMEQLLRNYLKRGVKYLIISVFFLVGFGIYLGRYLRFNSWDIISNPIDLLKDVLIRFTDPFIYPHTWGVTLLLGFFLTSIYWTLNNLKNRTNEN